MNKLSREQQIRKDIESFFKENNINHSIDDWNFLFEEDKFYSWWTKFMPSKELGNIAIGISEEIGSEKYLEDVYEIAFRIEDQISNPKRYRLYEKDSNI
jgi:hypothetical protein